MYKLLFILFIIKLYAQINIFKILLLRTEEQIHWLDSIIDYHRYRKKDFIDAKKKYSTVRDYKDIKKDLIRYHLQELVKNLELAKNSTPLFKLIKSC